MKKIFSFSLVFIMIFLCLAGCGSQDVPETTAQTTEPTVTETVPVQVEQTEPPEPTQAGLSLNHEKIILVSEGETFDIYNGSVDASAITWSSDNESIATVANGVVTAVATGSTTVHAEYDGQTLSCDVVCKLRFFKETTPAEGEDPVDQPDPSDPRAPVKAAPSTAAVSASFFDDAVFIGDSVTLKLSYYATDSGELGKAQFLVRGSYSVGHAANDSMLLTHRGSEMKIEDAVKATGAKKVFMMLGMNDIALYGIDQTIENWGKVVTRIRQTNPGVKIYIQSMTPIWTGGEKGSLNNENMDKYNSRLKAFAQDNDCVFIDIAPYMMDSTGGLATKYCSDSFVHVTDAGAAAWVKVLLAQNY